MKSFKAAIKNKANEAKKQNKSNPPSPIKNDSNYPSAIISVKIHYMQENSKKVPFLLSAQNLVGLYTLMKGKII